MTFQINGVDMTPYIKYQGVKWQRSDVDAPNSGRTLDGIMHRGRVATKVRLDVSCRPLKTAEISIVLQAIYPEFVTVTYDDPQQGGVVTRTMYSNNNPATFLGRKPNGEEFWSEISFPLIEQ